MSRRVLGVAAVLVSLVQGAWAAEPLATIAVIANPYVTTLPKGEIRDESGADRGFLADVGPPSMEKTVALVNQIKPDALVVLGSCTWSGRQADFQKLQSYLSKITAPQLIVPGHRDRTAESLNTYREAVGNRDAALQTRDVNGVQLVFATDLHTNPQEAMQRMEQQLAKAPTAKAVLLFAARDRTMGRSKLETADQQEAFHDLVARHHVALQIEPSRYSHRVGMQKTLPQWTVGSTSWSARGAVSVLRIYPDHIDAAQVAEVDAPTFGLTIPNPVTAPRLSDPKDDPYGSPSYTQDLAAKPRYTFALVSDPQYDRETSREFLIQKADKAIEELNRLQPAMVFVAGDLVNNNLPEEWEMFQKKFAKLKPPYHVAPGNHDVLFNYDFVEAGYASAPKQKPEYAEIVRRALLQAKQEGFEGPTALYEKYTGVKPRRLIEHEDSAFIIVPFLTTRADPEQIDYLKQQLEKVKDKRHVFVVAHYPSLPAFGNNLLPERGGADVLSLLHQHRVTGYLFGHRHRNGFRMHERTAHVLTDNMLSIHVFHVFDDRIVIGRKAVGAPLYEKLVIPATQRR